MAQKISQKTHDVFLAWLDKELQERDWSDYRLSKEAKLAPSVISKARNDGRPMGWEACVAVAQALQYPPEIVLRRAGHLPPQPDENQDLIELQALFDQMTPEQREEFLRIGRLKVELQQGIDERNRPAKARA